MNQIDLREWSTPNSYGNNYKPLPDSAGVYLLVVREFGIGTVIKKIVYVGSSASLSNRLAKHPTKKRILKEYKSKDPFDVACYFKCCENYIEEEKKYIKLTQARWNKRWR